MRHILEADVGIKLKTIRGFRFSLRIHYPIQVDDDCVFTIKIDVKSSS